MKLSLIIFRHGETAFNRDRIFCGWSKTQLDETGIKQAIALSKKLSKENIDFGFCSDLTRSKQTLATVLENHKKSKVIIDQRIKERNYGIFTGHSKALIKSLYPDLFAGIHRGYYAKIPYGENFSQVGERVFPFMNELLSFMQKNEVNTCLSLHNNSMRVVREYLENLSPNQVEKIETFPADYKKYLINFD